MKINKKMLDKMYFERQKCINRMDKIESISIYGEDKCGQSHDEISNKIEYKTTVKCKESIDSIIEWYIADHH